MEIGILPSIHNLNTLLLANCTELNLALSFVMELYQGIRYLILTGMLVALAVTSYDGIKAVKNKVTG